MKWFSNDLKINGKWLNALYKRSIREPDNMNHKLMHKKERLVHKRTLNIAKTRAWLNYCNNISNAYDKPFQIIGDKTLQNSDLVDILQKNFSIIADYHEIINQLLKEHFETNIDYTTVDMHFRNTISRNNHNYDGISSRKLKMHSSSLPSKKTPEFNTLDARVVKNLTTNNRELIKLLFNKCFE